MASPGLRTHHTPLQFTTPFMLPKSKWRGQSRERHSWSHLLLPPQERRGQLHCTEITHTWCSSSLRRSELLHSLKGSWFSLHLYWKVNLNLYLWRKLWRTFHRFLAIIKTLLRNQIFCSFVPVWETLNKTTQLSTQRHSQKALEIKWSTEGNHDSSVLSVSQSTDRNNRGTAAALNSHSVPKTFI